MDPVQRRGWRMVAVIFLVILVINGAAYMTQSLFFTPILKTFGWSRAKMSTLTAMVNIALAFGSMPVGWLLDRIAARLVITGGIVLVGAGFLLASFAHSYPTLVVADSIVGLGLAASAMVPGAYVVANWFDNNRGLGLAVIASAIATGGMTMNLVVSRMIVAFGWRATYQLLVPPFVLLIIPLVLLVIRSRPRTEASSAAGAGRAQDELPGLQLREAFVSPSFWLLVVSAACFGFSANGTLLHTVPNLISIGYTPAHAALAISMVLGAAAIGKLILGVVADRKSGKGALSFALFCWGAACIAMFYARHPLLLVLYVIFGGGSGGAPSALFPFVLAQVVGLRRYGTLSGILTWSLYIGGVVGIVMGGWLFDLTGSYNGAFALYSALLTLGGIGVLVVKPLASQRAQPVGAPAISAAS